MDVMDVHRLVHHLPAEVIGRSVGHAALDAAAASHMLKPCGLWSRPA